MTKRIYLFIFPLAIILAGQALAAVDISPVEPALNPVTNTLYVVYNPADNLQPAQIKSYTYKSLTPRAPKNWFIEANATQTLPNGARCYGLAVSAAGDKLYASISNSFASKVRVYGLDQSGLPTGSTDMTGAKWQNGSSPAGLALDDAKSRLYVADKGLYRLLVFNTQTNAWVTDASYANASPHFNVALTSDKLYVSTKDPNGQILVYNYVGDNITYDGARTNALGTLPYPTYLRTDKANNLLYAVVNGNNGTDLMVFSTVDEKYVGSVSSGITGAFGWSAFDLDTNNNKLYLKKALNYPETTAQIFRVDLPISGVQYASGTGLTAKAADGLKISLDRGRLVASYSQTGTIETYPTSSINIITVTSPKGGETWPVNSMQNITWTSTNPIANINVDLSVDGGKTWSLITTGANNQTFSWTVPDKPTTEALIRVSDATNPYLNGRSASKFTIGQGGGVAVSKLGAKRDGDTVGSSVTINWTTSPNLHDKNVDIYTSTGSFSTNAVTWQKVMNPVINQSGDTDTYTDTENTVGNGKARYYKVIPKGATLKNSDLTQDVTGKFDLHLKANEFKLISFPITPVSLSVVDVIGNQLDAGFDPTTSGAIYEDNAGSWLVAWKDSGSNKWLDPQWQDSTMSLEPGKGYWFFEPTTPFVWNHQKPY